MCDSRQPYYDNAIPVIPVDYKEHTNSRPFCNTTLNPDCPCREDEEAIQVVNQYVQAGLLTPQEATRTVEGRIL